MPGEIPLHPDTRALYDASLRPPNGMVFDAGVATTFSLEFDTALAMPVTIALFASESREELLQSPLALLEGLERTADKLAIFCDAGRIQARPKVESRLCTLLERIVVEVSAPNGGAFHPKTWVLRYRPPIGSGPDWIRLLMLSRNLTRDRSWDLCLCLDGRVGNSPRNVNRPLVDFLCALTSLATNPIPLHTAGVVEGLSKDLHHARWDLPQQFGSVAFAVNGLGRDNWTPTSCSRMGIVSPFCDAKALKVLANLTTRQRRLLVSRPSELAAIPKAVLELFSKVYVLDEKAQTEDGEDIDCDCNGNVPRTGLHAKALIQERGWNTSITVGSGNATTPALVSGRNVEVFATLTGRRSRVGSVNEMLAGDGFGQLLRPYQPGEVAETHAEQLAANQRVDAARCELVRAKLKLRYEAVSPRDADTLWRAELQSTTELLLAGIGTATAWPITLGEPHKNNVLDSLRLGDLVQLAPLALADVTKYIAFHVSDQSGKAEALFALGLEVSGAPENRISGVIRSVISSRATFLRYLRLLLADMHDPLGAWREAAHAGAGAFGGPNGTSEPILEDLVRALLSDRSRLGSVRRLVRHLRQSRSDAGDGVVPEDFLQLWEAFRTVLDENGVDYE